MIFNSCLSAHTQKCENKIKQTLVTIGEMTYVREVTETDFYDCMCSYYQFDSLCEAEVG